MGIFNLNNDKKLSLEMKAQAVNLGLCKMWTDEWEDDTSKEELVGKFIAGLDFCLEHDWPSVADMKRLFGGVMQKQGVFADERVAIKNAATTILNGSCECSATFDGCASGDIYVRHKSILRVKAHDDARVFVTVLNNASVEVTADGASKVFVYRYDDGKVLSSNGNVVIRDKTHRGG